MAPVYRGGGGGGREEEEGRCPLRRQEHSPCPAAGSHTSKRVPRPGSLHTSTRPPQALMICCTTASPRPVPRSFVEKNGSKMRALTCSVIPWPVSLTDSRTHA